MKTFLTFLAMLPGLLAAQTVSETVADSLSDSTATDSVLYVLDRQVQNDAFAPHEKLIFRIRYGFITAGRATMEVVDTTMLNDSIPVYEIMSTAHSNSTFDVFYKVRDTVRTFLDRDGLFSWRYKKQLREGSYKYDLSVDYLQQFGKAAVHRIRYHNDEPLRIKNENQFELEIPQYVLDILAAFYYVRTQELNVGEPIYMTNHDNKKIYDLQVIIQKKERIKVKAGEFDCIKIQPILQGESLFKQDGRLWVWVTDDQYKIPVQMKSKVVVGSITTELIAIEGIDGPIPAQRK